MHCYYEMPGCSDCCQICSLCASPVKLLEVKTSKHLAQYNTVRKCMHPLCPVRASSLSSTCILFVQCMHPLCPAHYLLMHKEGKVLWILPRLYATLKIDVCTFLQVLGDSINCQCQGYQVMAHTDTHTDTHSYTHTHTHTHTQYTICTQVCQPLLSYMCHLTFHKSGSSISSNLSSDHKHVICMYHTTQALGLLLRGMCAFEVYLL